LEFSGWQRKDDWDSMGCMAKSYYDIKLGEKWGEKMLIVDRLFWHTDNWGSHRTDKINSSLTLPIIVHSLTHTNVRTLSFASIMYEDGEIGRKKDLKPFTAF
jgi:hypothetical protein